MREIRNLHHIVATSRRGYITSVRLGTLCILTNWDKVKPNLRAHKGINMTELRSHRTTKTSELSLTTSLIENVIMTSVRPILVVAGIGNGSGMYSMTIR